ncbi:fatty acyl-CoA reductase wat-like [Drosophila subobscura]|uniref:fatty acyl-CoA reductase wat-like n=1 Tax=Drosophila subobscura TaxID=7241 RepID=UPI00155AC99C|nr:fatty acyl-CoA reductase wat-like [Drosophila subobscura]
MNSDIQGFYKGKTIFLTGGTGFLGKVIIEKLLRSTEVKRIYSMTRPKRGQSTQERVAKLETDVLFEELLKLNPDALKRLVPIVGDCLEPDLGISAADRKLLAAEVQIVIHSAATVRFDEALHLALDLNTRATRLMVQLAKQMVHLQSYVHISTAYSNCVVTSVKEKLYPEHLSCSSDKVLAIREHLSDKLIDDMTPALLGLYPNTYTYTKALAEDVILREAVGLPVCIFRPAIIVPTYKEPVLGWSDNMNGPMAIMFGCALGVVRLLCIDTEAHIGLVPVDYCANVALACAWKTDQSAHSSGGGEAGGGKPTVYTLAPSEKNLITFGRFINQSVSCRDIFPLSKMVWYPFVHCVLNPWLFSIGAFFYHILPGYFMDLMLRLSGRKPRMVNIYRKIHKNIALLGPFTSRSFALDTRNTNRLQELMSAKDRLIFQFDMAVMDWEDYFKTALLGIRIYLGKDPHTPESVAQALKLLKRLRFMHNTLKASLACGAGAILWSLFKLIMN